MDCDVIIIGGGPAGLMAAKTAVDEGLKVILVEQKKDAADYVKPCCSMPHPADGNIVVLGDSASFQEVENQGALMCGHVASKLAADCLAGKEDNLEKYNEFWLRSFEFNRPGVVETSARSYAIHTFADGQIDYLFSLENDFTVPGFINHNTCANVMFAGFSRHYNRIKQERPEIAVTIDTFKSAAVDSLLQT